MRRITGVRAYSLVALRERDVVVDNARRLFFTTNIVLDQQVLTAAGPTAFKAPGTKRGAI